MNSDSTLSYLGQIKYLFSKDELNGKWKIQSDFYIKSTPRGTNRVLFLRQPPPRVKPGAEFGVTFPLPKSVS